MKKLIYSLCAFMMVSVSASAQFMTSQTQGTSSDVPDKMSFFSVSYSPATMNVIEGAASVSDEMHSVSAAWSKAEAVHPSQPVYLEYGLTGQWLFDKEDEVSTNFVALKVPANLMYKYDIPQTTYSIAPYVGLNLTGYLLGTSSVKSGNEKVSVNWFSKDDMGDERFNRITVGWQVGAKVYLNDIFVGIGYEGPVTQMYKDGDLKSNFTFVNISLGMTF